MTVSYLISSYNKGNYLSAVLQTVRSEIAQTGGEIIVIDDGSKDASWQIIKEFKQSDTRISIFHQKNMGIFNVTNQLLERGHCKWLRFIDCDDPLVLGSTFGLLQIGDRNQADYVFGSMISYGPEPLTIDQIELRNYEGCAFQLLEDPLAHAITAYNHIPAAALIRRSALNADVRIPEDLISCQDLAVALNVFERGRVIRLDAPVCWQLVGVSHRLSSREALTFHQTIEIIRRFGEGHFTQRYREIAIKKVLSRSLRWMRRNRLIKKQPATYISLLFAYSRSRAGLSLDWNSTMRLAAIPLEQDVADVLRGRRIY